MYKAKCSYVYQCLIYLHRFHGLLWPSLLLAAGFEPPRKLLCHSHWLVNGEKMSKSRQNVINPLSEPALKLTTSGLRYFLLREGVAHSDGSKYAISYTGISVVWTGSGSWLRLECMNGWV
jgi:hypothetical protein